MNPSHVSLPPRKLRMRTLGQLLGLTIPDEALIEIMSRNRS